MKKLTAIFIFIYFILIYSETASAKATNNGFYIDTGIIFFAGVVIIILLILLSMLVSNRKKLKISKDEIDNANILMKTFFDADSNMVYMKDENLKYVLVNHALEEAYHKKAEEFIGYDDFQLTNEEFAKLRRRSDQEVLKKDTLIVDEVQWDNKVYKSTKFPVKLQNGKSYIGAYIFDITEERERIKKNEKVLNRQMILADILMHSFNNKQEQLDYVLNEAIKLTESICGHIFLYDEAKREFILNSWTKGVIQNGEIFEKHSVFHFDKAGLWGEVVRQRRPIIINDCEKLSPQNIEYPKGHIQIKKFMSIPIIFDEKIVAIIGLANKESDYDDSDVYEITLLMNGVWNAVERRETQDKLCFERNKYLQTIISIGDGVLVVDRNGNIEMLNSVAEKLTGWTMAEAFGMPYKDIFVLNHDQEDITFYDPIEEVFASNNYQNIGNCSILHSKDGSNYHLENSAAPIKNEADQMIGVVLVFRDVTEKKEQHKKIEYLSFHDSLTGLYNRRFFEEEMKYMDTERNLPLSIIIGDVNGLKLTNDIFGHSFGDILLKNIADVMKRVCRTDDIIARWGGDEFVLLLPKTNIEEANQIIKQIKEEFSKWHIKAIKGSISMGADTKNDMTEMLVEVLNRAEDKMYVVKTLERKEVQSKVIDAIITNLHENNIREKGHSIRVSELCKKLGTDLKLSEVEIRKLKEAGYLHDIGKIILDSKLIDDKFRFDNQDWFEMKKHTIAGYRILNSFDKTTDLAEAVFSHHEHWDGSGFPNGLRREEIPLLARIISIVESYERLLYDSEGNKTMSRIEAVNIIKANANIKFDPQLVESFIHMLEINPTIEDDSNIITDYQI
ncbi:MAG: diguanylate cyclase [Herbinix sp.]|nr:diguanylate cyclase [Herbinix sp.]